MEILRAGYRLRNKQVFRSWSNRQRPEVAAAFVS
jgi:hypothetical protein